MDQVTGMLAAAGLVIDPDASQSGGGCLSSRGGVEALPTWLQLFWQVD